MSHSAAAREAARRASGQFGTQTRHEAEVRLAANSGASHRATFTGSSSQRQAVGLPGHCDDCAARGHLESHPDLGCSDVGCDSSHPEEAGDTVSQSTGTLLRDDRPLKRLPLHATSGTARGLANEVSDGDIDLAPPYQRGSRWSQAQRVNLIRSLRLGVPVPAIVLNDRHTPAWYAANPEHNRSNPSRSTYAVIDGKQRLETLRDWFEGSLPVPASWFEPEEIVTTIPTPEGPHVTWRGLTPAARSNMGTEATMPRIYAALPTVQAEAEMYLLLNTGGTEQSPADLSKAADVARDSAPSTPTTTTR